MPEIVPGVAGVAGLTVTDLLLAELVPQLLVAVTVIFPLAVPVVTVMDVVP